MNREQKVVLNQKSKKTVLASWQTPTLRKIDAREAEVSTHNNSDGGVNS